MFNSFNSQKKLFWFFCFAVFSFSFYAQTNVRPICIQKDRNDVYYTYSWDGVRGAQAYECLFEIRAVGSNAVVYSLQSLMTNTNVIALSFPSSYYTSGYQLYCSVRVQGATLFSRANISDYREGPGDTLGVASEAVVMRGPISGTASDSARNGYYRTYCRLDGSNRAFKRISTVSTGISANGTIYKINIWQKYLTTSASANPAPPAPGTLSAPGTDFCISFISFVNSLSLSISVAITGTPTLAEVSVGDPSSLTCRIANTAVSEPFSDLSLSPNPFSKDLTISGSFEKDEIVNLEIRNMQGQLVAQPWVNKSLPAGNFTENLELGNFSSGIYFYSLRSTTRRNTGKIVKMD